MPILPRCHICLSRYSNYLLIKNILYIPFTSRLKYHVTQLSCYNQKKSATTPLKERRNNSATADYYTNIYFYSDIQKKLRFLHNLNQFVKNIVQKLHKIFKISSETQMFRSNLNNSFLYMFRLFAQYLLLRININETYIVLLN